MQKPNTGLSETLLTSEAARALGVGEGTIRAWDRIGLLTASRTARGIRLFARADVERLAREREARTQERAPNPQPDQGAREFESAEA